MKKSNPHFVLLAILIGTLALAAECEDDENLSDNGNNENDTGSGNNGPPTPGSSSDCDNELPEQMNDCTDADLSEYNNCVVETCVEEYKACLGDNYAQGDYTGGHCENLQNCVEACGCDETCVEECSQNNLTPKCLGCIAELGMCGLPCMDNLECVN